jgi:hypothetical protein
VLVEVGAEPGGAERGGLGGTDGVLDDEGDHLVGVLVEEVLDGVQRVEERDGAERALVVAEEGAVSPFAQRSEPGEERLRNPGWQVGVDTGQLLVGDQRGPVVRVDEQRPDAGVELRANVAALLGPDAHDVGARHRVVRRGVHDLVVATAAELGVAIAGPCLAVRGPPARPRRQAQR